MAEQNRWIVTVSKDRPFPEVRRKLTSAGFKVDEALADIGVIVGRCEKATVSRLRSIPGVADIASESPIDIGPPDSPTTW